MSSKSMYLGLFVVAGLNLSFWGTPLHASSADNCSAIGRGLMEGQTNLTCSRTENDRGRKAKTTVTTTDIFQTNENGEKVKTGIEAIVTTEAGCDPCDVKAGSKVTSLSYGLEQLKNINSVQSEILAKAEEQEDEARKELNQKIALKKAMDNCTRNADGDRLDKEEQFECKLEKMADLEDEEAEAYFNKHLKADLEAKALSSDPSERAAALEALAQIEDNVLSENVLARIALINKASAEMNNLSNAQMQAKNHMMIAAQLPEGAQKQHHITQAKNLMTAAETRLQSVQVSAMTSIAQSNSADAATQMADLNGFFAKMKSNLDQTTLSSPELSKIKAETLAGETIQNVTGSAANVNNSTRIIRGGAQIPGGLLTAIPQVSGLPPSNSSQVGLPNAQNLGRGVSQNRLPAPLAGQQYSQPQVQIQPFPGAIQQGQQYNQFNPLGNQFQQAPGSMPGAMLPMM